MDLHQERQNDGPDLDPNCLQKLSTGYPRLSSYDFSKIPFSNDSFRNTIRASNSLNLDQDQHSVRYKLFAKVIRC